MSDAVLTPKQRDAAAAVDRIDDVIAEARLRWPTFWTKVEQVEEIVGGLPRPFTLVESRWTIDGQPHGLRDLLPPNAPTRDVEDAVQRIARHALYNAELRKG